MSGYSLELGFTAIINKLI